MANILSFSGFSAYYAYANFAVYYKTVEDAEWTNIGDNSAGLKAIPSWSQDSEMWVRLQQKSRQSRFKTHRVFNRRWLDGMKPRRDGISQSILRHLI